MHALLTVSDKPTLPVHRRIAPSPSTRLTPELHACDPLQARGYWWG